MRAYTLRRRPTFLPKKNFLHDFFKKSETKQPPAVCSCVPTCIFYPHQRTNSHTEESKPHTSHQHHRTDSPPPAEHNAPGTDHTSPGKYSGLIFNQKFIKFSGWYCFGRCGTEWHCCPVPLKRLNVIFLVLTYHNTEIAI